jgi:hypothetical protein
MAVNDCDGGCSNESRANPAEAYAGRLNSQDMMRKVAQIAQIFQILLTGYRDTASHNH